MKQIWLAALLVAVSTGTAVDAAAQGNGRGRGNDRPRAEAQYDRRDRDRDDDDRWDDDDDDRRDRREVRRDGRRVPPGWCIGRGNPHNTRENCGYRRDGRDGRRGSYAQRHADHHEWLTRECRARTRNAGGSIVEQLRARQWCARAHDDWHRREGVRH